MAYICIAVTIVAACGMIQAVYLFNAATDSDTTDMYGTFFFFPPMECNVHNFHFKLQLLPRKFIPVVVRVEMTLNGEWNRYYGELRDGNSTTLYLPCRMDNQAVSLTATGEVLVHVMMRNDSYAVLPANVLGKTYSLLSLPAPNYNNFFVTVTTYHPCLFEITNASGKIVETKELEYNGVYTFTSPTTLTGYGVSADSSIFVVSGMFSSRDPETVLMEHVRPINTLGRRYVLPLFFQNKRSKVFLTAYAEGKTQMLSLKSGDLQGQLPTNGTVVDLNKQLEGTKSVLVVSASKPFQLLFLMTSQVFPSILNNREGFRMHSLVSIAAVEQYMSDSCTYHQLNTKSSKTIVAGLKTEQAKAEVFSFWQDGQTIELDTLWVRTIDLHIQDIATYLINAKATAQRLWFLELDAIRRGFAIYYLEGGSHVSKLVKDPACSLGQRVDHDDQIDNDCDGLIDEEQVNGVDDDGDMQTDEDTTVQKIRNCQAEKPFFYWEPNRYRNTRFESEVYEFAERLPPQSTEMVLISATVGVIMVFIFIFIIWCIDFLTYLRDPGALPKIF